MLNELPQWIVAALLVSVLIWTLAISRYVIFSPFKPLMFEGAAGRAFMWTLAFAPILAQITVALWLFRTFPWWIALLMIFLWAPVGAAFYHLRPSILYTVDLA